MLEVVDKGTMWNEETDGNDQQCDVPALKFCPDTNGEMGGIIDGKGALFGVRITHLRNTDGSLAGSVVGFSGWHGIMDGNVREAFALAD